MAAIGIFVLGGITGVALEAEQNEYEDQQREKRPSAYLAVQYCYYQNSTGHYPVGLNIYKYDANNTADRTWYLSKDYPERITQHSKWEPREWNCDVYGYSTYKNRWIPGEPGSGLP